MPVRPAIIPGLIYDDALAAIAFLCDAFGFERRLVVPGEAPGEVVHAQLTLDGNFIMLGSATVKSRAQFEMAAPDGLVTGYINVVLDDPDAHHARAAAARATIVTPPHDNDYGGRSYEARDVGGQLWSFGSYDPSA